MGLVRLTVVANLVEAQMIESLLSTEGIESLRKQTNFGAGSMDGWSGGQQEILVNSEDLEAARELLRPWRVTRGAYLLNLEQVPYRRPGTSSARSQPPSRRVRSRTRFCSSSTRP